MSKLIIAEKPSVAKSIASALGASSRADGFYEGSGLIVSWCVGHLVSPLDAGGYDERFKKWRYTRLSPSSADTRRTAVWGAAPSSRQ